MLYILHSLIAVISKRQIAAAMHQILFPAAEGKKNKITTIAYEYRIIPEPQQKHVCVDYQYSNQSWRRRKNNSAGIKPVVLFQGG